MNKSIAIITARGGSKRIPRKNIKEFFGQPMIKYAIDAALESKIFDTVMVSTDDEEIAQISKKNGADIPFMRSERTANDFATTMDVLLEVIYQYKKMNIEYNSLCCIYPCVPFLKGDTLISAYNSFTESNTDALMPVVRFSYPIQRALRINKDDLLEYVQPEYIKARSQDLEPTYHDVGMFYFYKVDSLSIQNKKIKYFEMKESEIQDIDTEEDWNYAEMKYSIKESLSK
ncbi:pseudaminic acid cytidylyltransferase [Treponema sp. R80B11-R83G3]